MHRDFSTGKRRMENFDPSCIMDYCTLNKWTVHNTYTLPLISNILGHLQGKTLFTKMDIWWGYNNICIKEEDCWKAAFKTPFGLQTHGHVFWTHPLPCHLLLHYEENAMTNTQQILRQSTQIHWQPPGGHSRRWRITPTNCEQNTWPVCMRVIFPMPC